MIEPLTAMIGSTAIALWDIDKVNCPRTNQAIDSLAALVYWWYAAIEVQHAQDLPRRKRRALANFAPSLDSAFQSKSSPQLTNLLDCLNIVFDTIIVTLNAVKGSVPYERLRRSQTKLAQIPIRL